MKRILFYFYYFAAIMARLINPKLYMVLIVKAHKTAGVIFDGIPEYIDYHSHLDPSGGLTIGTGAVISTQVIILTHDWSFLKKLKAKGEEYTEMMHLEAFSSVDIGEESFIGAGAVVLPGTKIGKYSIVGAGAVVKGCFADYSVIVGTPAKRIKDIRE